MVRVIRLLAAVGVAAHSSPPEKLALPHAASGCCGGADAAGAIAGVAMSAGAGSDDTAATSNTDAAAVATGRTNTAAATSAADNADIVTRATMASLAAGCITINVTGGTHYPCGNTWFQASYGANGMFHQAVATS